jgi:hypothetical protein
MKQPAKRGRGRPPLEDEPMVQLTFRLPKSMIDTIDEIRSRQIDPPERATVVRRLLTEGLERERRRR